MQSPNTYYLNDGNLLNVVNSSSQCDDDIAGKNTLANALGGTYNPDTRIVDGHSGNELKFDNQLVYDASERLWSDTLKSNFSDYVNIGTGGTGVQKFRWNGNITASTQYVTNGGSIMGFSLFKYSDKLRFITIIENTPGDIVNTFLQTPNAYFQLWEGFFACDGTSYPRNLNNCVIYLADISILNCKKFFKMNLLKKTYGVIIEISSLDDITFLTNELYNCTAANLYIYDPQGLLPQPLIDDCYKLLQCGDTSFKDDFIQLWKPFFAHNKHTDLYIYADGSSPSYRGECYNLYIDGSRCNVDIFKDELCKET